jgi:hypothetical protein
MKVDTDDDSFDSMNPPFAPNVWFDYGFNWYGVDETGSIGIFQASESPIPSKIFTNEISYREIDYYFRHLPETTTAELADGKIREVKTVIGRPIDYSDSLIEASKGLYCIKDINTSIEIKKRFRRTDRQNLYGYYLIAIPTKKINITDLPDNFRLFLESYCLPIKFSEIEKVDVEKFLICN